MSPGRPSCRLHIKPAQLRGRAGLRDVADLPLQCLGSCRCSISPDGLGTEHDVYFIPSAKSLFLSLSTCKDLGLVPASFPPPPPAGGAGAGGRRRGCRARPATRQVHGGTVSATRGARAAAGGVTATAILGLDLQHHQESATSDRRRASSHPPGTQRRPPCLSHTSVCTGTL